jgi:hypothetical protein
MFADSLSAHPSSPGSIRNLEIRDLPAVARLLVAHHIDPRAIPCSTLSPHKPFPRCHVLVLDLDGAIHALAYLVLDRRPTLHGHLQLLVVDPTLIAAHGRAIEDRLAGVAIALCEAYGCADIDIAAPSRDRDDSAAYPIPRYAVG